MSTGSYWKRRPAGAGFRSHKGGGEGKTGPLYRKRGPVPGEGRKGKTDRTGSGGTKKGGGGRSEEEKKMDRREREREGNTGHDRRAVARGRGRKTRQQLSRPGLLAGSAKKKKDSKILPL